MNARESLDYNRVMEAAKAMGSYRQKAAVKATVVNPNVFGQRQTSKPLPTPTF